MAHKKWDIDLVGILASEEYVENKIGKPSIFINSQNSIQFNIKVISETPESFPNVQLFSAFSSDIEPYGYEDLYAEPHQRKDSVQVFLEDQLIVFKPVRKLRPGGPDIYQVSDVRLYPKTSGFHETSTFIPVPIFSEKTHGYTFEEFIEKLKTNRFMGRIQNFSTEPNDTPEYVLWKDENEEYLIVGPFESHRHAHGGFCFQFTTLKMDTFREEWFEDAFEDREILFIGIETYRQLTNLMELPVDLLKENNRDEDIVNDDTSKGNKSNSIAFSGPINQLTDMESKEAGDIASGTTSISAGSSSATLNKEDSKPQDERGENAFLEHLIQLARERSLLYDERDLINFHTAMKSSTLVILSGISGTGKSRLVEIYGRALGMDDQQLSIIPVRPSWTDDADLIGYVDSIHNVYRPGDSGLLDTLVDAANNPNKLYIVCFDEMNLARVEHYFSQFLSVLEMTPYSRRQLHLYNEELEPRLYNAARYPHTITVGENVMFVGTVNLDESTYHFSDKVLDRANVLSLKVLPFSQLKDLKDRKERKDFAPRRDWSLEDFRSFKSQTETIQLTDREIEFLEGVHQEMGTINSTQGIGHRIVRQIDGYLKNLPDRDVLTRQDAFDLQMVQRILTKVRGPEDQLKPLLGSYTLETEEIRDSLLIELLDRFQDVSNFLETRLTLKHKSKELRLHGYTV